MVSSDLIEAVKKTAQLYGQEGYSSQEISTYQELVEINSSDWNLYYYLGKAHEKYQKIEEAIEAYRNAIKFNANNAELYYLLGKALLQVEKYQEAVEASDRAVALSPTSSHSYCILGDSLLKLQHWDKSFASYGKAIKLKPSLYNRIYTYLNTEINTYSQEIDKVISICQINLTRDPNDLVYYIALSKAFSKLGNLDETAKAYAKQLFLLQNNPNSSQQVGLELERTIEKINAERTNNTDDRGKPQKIIYHVQQGGLCNRLRTLYACLALSNVYQIPFVVCWLPSETCNCYLEDLLEPVFNNVDSQQIFLELEDCLVNTIYITNTAMSASSCYAKYLKNSQDISNEDYLHKYYDLIRNIPIKPELKQSLTNFLNNNNWQDDIVGIHVRRTDHVKHFSSNPKTANELSTDEKFFQIIDRHIEEGFSRFFLATDDAETKAMFEAKYPGRFLSYCREFSNSSLRQTSIQDALLDLYLLSKTKRLIGSNHSTFSIYASELGDIPLEFA